MKRSKILAAVLILCFVVLSSSTSYAFYDGGTPVGTLEQLQALTCPRCGEHITVAVSVPATCTTYGDGYLYCDYCGYGYYGAGTFRYATPAEGSNEQV